MRWFYLVPLSWLLQFVGIFVVPIALLFAGKRLPAWAWWWGNDTDTIDGDPSWQMRTIGWPIYCRRWAQLMRNRCHNWSLAVGCLQDSQCKVHHVGVRPSNYHGIEGEYLSIAERDGVTFWHYYRIARLWFWPSRGERIRLGHKLEDLAPNDARRHYIAALVCYYHPCVRMPPEVKA